MLDLDAQFIHCRITIRCAHLSILATVVYGANDTISRRGLWQKLVLLANSISDEPWIVGGDFNTVLDMSEVCGSSADIHSAMTEFRDCLLDTGLIQLPVQGERFSWHNCSEGDRSLWKRLDRMLVNDAWLSQWPNSHYHCLNARTSDHSPLVIRGDTATHTVSMFRFDNYLTMSSDFTPSVQNIWRHRIEGTAMYAVTRKLQALKPISSYKAGANHAATTGENSMAKGWRSVLPDLLPKATARGERRREFLDLRYLRPWARHVVTPDECMELVQSVTREEIKDAFFDIAEDKAPGPDGYSSGFYKAAWPVIGEEVVKAILEFFTTGRLLKQVNTTILALIPKGLPMRCALKVDLRKAYDTVEWDFLSAVLHLFGFPDIFIGWIEECVTTPMSRFASMEPSRVLQGFQGVATGDPLSPFLFVLIMEVLQLMLQQLIDQNEGFSFHWRCKEIGLFQLCFADDLLLFCKPDVASVRIFRHGLDEFAKLSGLHANPQKSQLILSRSAQPMREHLLAALQFQEGHLPLSRIKGWDSIQLSFAGRLQLIKSVLMSLNVYWAMAFILPKGVIRATDGGRRSRNPGYPSTQKAFMSRHLWNVIQSNQSSIWVQWIAHTHLRHKSVWTVDAKGGSWGWRKLLRLRSALLPYIEFKVGNGEIFSIWHDPWHSLGTLIRRFPSGPSRTNIPIAAKLSEVIVDGDWSWPPITDMECIEILHLLPTIHNGSDSILWRGGEFTTVAYGIFRTPGPIVGWYPLLSGPCKIPRFSFVLWLAILGKLSTMDKPWLPHLGGVCVLCGREVETHEHLFFRCSYSRRCIRDLKEAVRFTWPNRAWGEDITWASTRWKGRHIVQAAYRALLSAIVYHIWRERNQRVFQHSERPSTTIARIAAEEIRQKILSLDLSDSVSTRGLYRLWRIPWPVRDTA
ncbi:hypothetical protein Sango_3068900 [Sesamum angolense]|uniref:Reverse transcriptase domain-containing protein n=1 Tax=Sesamum angolense TaxID=2727404 RepID=A0AAE1VYY6_9LAMI|nr:hypothetical protein Sango_3068900 [Sesamum angolense]